MSITYENAEMLDANFLCTIIFKFVFLMSITRKLSDG